MQAIGGNSLVQRMIGAARLDVPTYEAVEHDESATPQAAIVVVLASLAAGIGALNNDDRTAGFISGLVGSLLGWVVSAAIVYLIGTRLLAGAQTQATLGQVLRTLGFANTAGILAVFGFLPAIGWLFVLVAGVLVLIARFIAIRAALDISTGRAIAVAVATVIVSIVIGAIIAGIFNVDMGM